MESLWRNYIITPLIAIIGIIVVGAVIEDGLGIKNATMLLFTAAGGIWFVSKFFRRNK